MADTSPRQWYYVRPFGRPWVFSRSALVASCYAVLLLLAWLVSWLVLR